MRSIDGATIRRMMASLYIQKPWNSPGSTRFWILLVLAAVIATAGVIADSTATVIGAMIVAPLMTPILGSALAIVLADRSHLVRSVFLIIAGAAAVVLVGYLMGLIAAPPDAFTNNDQVSARISPRLIDLIAALATGTVGAFALIRSDISDALPGVAVAISLVPPLTVTGLLLRVHRYHDAGQSALLFATNVTAIIATGTFVFLLYRIRATARTAGMTVGELRGPTLVAVAALVVVVAAPLTVGSLSVARDERLAATAEPLARNWARPVHWQIADVRARAGTVTVIAVGQRPPPDPAELRHAFNTAGLADAGLRVELIDGDERSCPARQSQCLTAN